MKKLISLIISVIFIISALPVMANETTATTLTNVALNRPGFAFLTYGAQNADLATDGNPKTYYQYNYAGRYHVDLGEAYTIDNIKLNLLDNGYNQNYRVYLSNTLATGQTSAHGTKTFTWSGCSDKVTVATVGATGDASVPAMDENGYVTFSLTDEQKATKYRYVCVEHDANMVIGEIEVNTPDTVAANPYYWVEVAAFKPVFATTYQSADYMPYNANDRNTNTGFITSKEVTWADGDTTATPNLKQRLVIDLGKEMPINAIVYRRAVDSTLGAIGGTGIYVTNDTSLASSSMTTIWTDGGNLNDYNYFKVPASGTKGRYIVVESIARKYPLTTGANYHMLGTADVLVYSDTTAGVTAPTLKKTTDRTHLVSYDMPATNNTNVNHTPGNLVDGKLTTVSTVGHGGTRWFYIDLVNPQSIDYIATMRYDSASSYSMKGNFIFATNRNDKTYDPTKGDALIYAIPEAGLTAGVMNVHPATSVMEGKKYRYIAMVAPDSDAGDWTTIEGMATAATASRVSLALLDVYTKEANFKEVFTTVSFAQAEGSTTDYSVSATKFLSVTDGKYTLVAAAYDADWKLIGVEQSNISMTYGVGAALSSSVSLADVTGIENAAHVKTMLWDTMSAIRPIVASETFDIGTSEG